MLKSLKSSISLPKSQTESINSQKASTYFEVHFGCLYRKPITTDEEDLQEECTSIQSDLIFVFAKSSTLNGTPF